VEARLRERQRTYLAHLGLVRRPGSKLTEVFVSDRSNYSFRARRWIETNWMRTWFWLRSTGRTHYFDPGAAFTPFDFWKWSETGRNRVALDKDGGTWITSTLPKSSESRIERDAKLSLSDTGDLPGKGDRYLHRFGRNVPSG